MGIYRTGGGGGVQLSASSYLTKQQDHKQGLSAFRVSYRTHANEQIGVVPLVDRCVVVSPVRTNTRLRWRHIR